MKLVIDYGNSRVKTALFDKDLLLHINEGETLDAGSLESFLTDKPGVTAAIISAVRDYDDSLRKYLRNHFFFIELNPHTPVPLLNRYLTPDSLGNDRLAGAVAANAMFPNQNVLVIDAGTCMTYNFIDDHNVFLGGGISPGLTLRLKALHTFTDKLPLIPLGDTEHLIGRSTAESILSGVINGTTAEINGIIEKYADLYPDVKVILTGGNTKYFDKRLKINIFVYPNLVLSGLNIILNHNIEA
jgi:type III pantothenate kinase